MKAHNKSSQHLNPYDVVVNEKALRTSSKEGLPRPLAQAHHLAKTVQADNWYSKVADGLIDALKPKSP